MSSISDKVFRRFLVLVWQHLERNGTGVLPIDFDVTTLEVQFHWDQITMSEKDLITLDQIKNNEFGVLKGKLPEWVMVEAIIAFPQFELIQCKYGGKVYAGIGSRETPAEVLLLMEEIAEYYCDDGWLLTSGGAGGADSAFYKGALKSRRFPQRGAKIYIAWNGMRSENDVRLFHDGKTFFDARRFPNYDQARDIAYQARGSFEGLSDGGIMLHSRNSYQILQDDLQTPVNQAILWAKPVGKKDKVSGGTNTAYQIALEHGVDIINLATEEGMARAMAYLNNNREKRRVQQQADAR